MLLWRDCNEAFKYFSDSWFGFSLFVEVWASSQDELTISKRLGFQISVCNYDWTRFCTSQSEPLAELKVKLEAHSNWSQTLCDAGLIGMLEWLRAKPRQEKQSWKKINKCISKNRWVSRTEGEIAQGECWWVAVAVTRPQDWTIIIKFPRACQVWPETCWMNHDSKSCTV